MLTYSAEIMLPEPPSSLLKESLAVGAEVSFELLVPEGGASGTLFPLDDEMEIEIVLTLGPAMHITRPITDTIMSTASPRSPATKTAGREMPTTRGSTTT